MTKTYTAPFAQTPKTGTAVVTVAAGGVTSDTPTGASLLMTAGADGAILTRLWAIPRGTAVAGCLLLFLSSDNGATLRLIDSETLPSYSASTGTGIPETQFGNYSEASPLRLAAGDRLYVANQVAVSGGVVFRAEWTDF